MDQHAFHDLLPEDFPFTIRFYDMADPSGPPLDTIVVDGPGVVPIKSYKPKRVRVTIEYPNGRIESADPPEETNAVRP